MYTILSPYGMHLIVYNCIYWETPRVFSWEMLQQEKPQINL